MVGVTGIEPMSYPPHGHILPLYYTPTMYFSPMRAHYHYATPRFKEYTKKKKAR